MPVTLEKVGIMSPQDKIDLEKVYNDFPTANSLTNVMAFISETANSSLYAARFNERLIGACTITENNDELVLENLCVRSITRNRRVGSDILRLAGKHFEGKAINAPYCQKSDALAQLFKQAGFSDDGDRFYRHA